MKSIIGVKVNDLYYGIKSPLDPNLAVDLRKELNSENPNIVAEYDNGEELILNREEGFHVISKIILHNKERDSYRIIANRIREKSKLEKIKLAEKRRKQKLIKRETKKAKKR